MATRESRPISWTRKKIEYVDKMDKMDKMDKISGELLRWRPSVGISDLCPE